MRGRFCGLTLRFWDAIQDVGNGEVTRGWVIPLLFARKTLDVNTRAVQSYRDLTVWKRAIELCLAMYRITVDFPRDEIYGLTNQMRRASISIPSNIAEGYGRLSREQYRHFLGIAQGSNFELQTQLVIARELNFVDRNKIERIEDLCNEVGKMLGAMLRNMPSSRTTSQPLSAKR